MEDVILVPGHQRMALLAADQRDNLRVQGDDGSTWVKPIEDQVRMLTQFLAKSSDVRHFRPCTGTRIGYDGTGVFIHQDHMKRYFGLIRETASIAVRSECPVPVPRVQGCGGIGGGGSSERLMGAFLMGVPSITSNVRRQVLNAAFRGVDKDNSGVLEKDEMVALIRRVMPTMSGRQVVELMQNADKNNDSVVNYNEFVSWLESGAPAEVQKQLEAGMRTEYDCVRAVFRMWDRNGDGLITRRELNAVLRQTAPEITPSQVQILCLNLDRNKDGNIDYDEFLSFLFG